MRIKKRLWPPISAIEQRETVWSEVFPGNYHTLRCFKPAVEATETALELSPEQRKRTVWRMDGGSGADDELRWLLAKGLSNRRAEALAAKVKRWDGYQENSWLGEVVSPVDIVSW